MRPHKNQKGYLLLEALIMVAIIAIVSAIAVPSALRWTQVNNERGAAMSLAVLNSAETASAQLYGQYMPPSSLVGSLSSPVSCANPMLISGESAQAPEGFSLSFVGSTPATSSVTGCGTVAGFNTFTVSLDPLSTLSAQRHFFLSSTDGLIHFAEGRPANISDSVMAISAPTQGFISTILSIQTTGTGTPTNPVNPPVTPAFSYTGSVVLDMPAGENFVVPLFGVATTISDVSASGGTCASCTDTVASAKTITGITITWNGGSLPPAAVGFRLWLPDDGNNNTAAGDYNYGNANCTNFTAIGSQCQLSISNLAATPTMPIGLLMVSNNGNLTGASFSWTVQTMN